MTEQLWVKRTKGGFPLSFYRIVGQPGLYRVWVRTNSPMDGFRPNLSYGKFTGLENAVAFLDGQFERTDKEEVDK